MAMGNLRTQFFSTLLFNTNSQHQLSVFLCKQKKMRLQKAFVICLTTLIMMMMMKIYM